MVSQMKMAASILALLLSLHLCIALPTQQQNTDDALPDILGRLHDVLESLRDYLQQQQVQRTNTADIVDVPPPKSIEERNEEGPIPEISEVDEPYDARRADRGIPEGFPEVNENDLELLERSNSKKGIPEGFPEVNENDLEISERSNKKKESKDLDALSKDVSLRDVLTYLLELEREKQSHYKQRSHQQRDHDIPFPLTGKSKSSGN